MLPFIKTYRNAGGKSLNEISAYLDMLVGVAVDGVGLGDGCFELGAGWRGAFERRGVRCVSFFLAWILWL